MHLMITSRIGNDLKSGGHISIPPWLRVCVDLTRWTWGLHVGIIKREIDPGCFFWLLKLVIKLTGKKKKNFKKKTTKCTFNDSKEKETQIEEVFWTYLRSGAWNASPPALLEGHRNTLIRPTWAIISHWLKATPF